MTDPHRYIAFFADIRSEDIASVGGKNASLGEMYRELTVRGVRIPNGFAITAEAFRYVLDSAGAWPRLHAALDELDITDVDDLARRAAMAREIIYRAPLPENLGRQILDAYAKLRAEYAPELTLAVRSSATAEDLPNASFAGQHETFLNISGEADLLDAVKRCFASLFKDRAIRYRVDNGFDHFKVFLSVGVMKMVRADIATSGVMFSLDTETGFRDVVFITGAYGLGENIVQGTVDPDEFYVFKPTLRAGFAAVLRRTLGAKKIKMIYAARAGRDATRNVPTAGAERQRFCISDADVLELATAALAIEDHYSAKTGRAQPMDIEWAKDGIDDKLYIVQARPETVASQKSLQVLEEYRLERKGEELVCGRAVGNKISAGRARVIRDVAQLREFQAGEVLVADTTMPDWGTVMKSAAAIVTNRGGRTCHAAIVARELGIPAVIGCDNATEIINTGDEVTVSCAQGELGHVYAGVLPVQKSLIDLTDLQKPRTRLMLNIGNPDIALKASLLPNDGVGLARMEFIIAEHIKVHPMAVLHPEKIDDAGARKAIAELTSNYAHATDFFVRELAEGIGMIAAAFYPKPVIVRLSDFKTNEYAALLGGRWFEPHEENPMIGFRGCYRSVRSPELFEMELDALATAREQLPNLHVMIPFVRTRWELEILLEQIQ
ncbi:MAG TPA: phosphoenolpyruvate synthase, partial [Spongiibacteraceae bacterium]|nr:phosphoenolpyruvate synthase [Spongiibacteraceae bacterium]